jgi:hypothetical protein
MALIAAHRTRAAFIGDRLGIGTLEPPSPAGSHQ